MFILQIRNMTADETKTENIRKEVMQAGKDIRTQFPILKHQNAIGFSIFLVSVLAIVLMSYGFIISKIPAWMMILSNAFWMSILHELEHDLIHFQYFKKNKIVQDFMLLVGWLLRPLTVNPWIRRHLHFHHHKFSGTLHDVEERGVTNGEKWGLKRLITTPDLLLGGILRTHLLARDIKNEVKAGHLPKAQALKFKKFSSLALLPFGLIAYFMWYYFLVHYIVLAFTEVLGIPYQSPAWSVNIMEIISPIVLILLIPNLVRQFCLHFITSNMHYFGDVESGNIMQQTQVLTAGWTFPFQLFCFFFGHTHAIHHFVVNETFYIRHFTRKRALQVMQKEGVRFNDMGTFRRANRYLIS